MPAKTVLVTGGTDFVASHCIVQLLAAGYRVRTALRSLRREAEVRAMVSTGGADAGDALSFVTPSADSDSAWAKAVQGCDFVLQVAAPLPPDVAGRVGDRADSAKGEVIRVLRAARHEGVKRVVMTSSFAAIAYGHKPTDLRFSEEDWTNVYRVGENTQARAKTLAERAAWDFIEREGGALELAVVNPVGTFGPALGPDLSNSVRLIEQLLDGTMPGTPRLAFPVVDVRDVAELQLRAMTDPRARGERFLAAGDSELTLLRMAQLLKERLGSAAARVPTRAMPDWAVRFSALVSPSVKDVVPDLGLVRRANNEKAKAVLGWTPRSCEETIVETAESLVRLGLVRGVRTDGTSVL